MLTGKDIHEAYAASHPLLHYATFANWKEHKDALEARIQALLAEEKEQ